MNEILEALYDLAEQSYPGCAIDVACVLKRGDACAALRAGESVILSASGPTLADALAPIFDHLAEQDAAAETARAQVRSRAAAARGRCATKEGL